ncbi:hypothetical protein LUZ60_005721 [Juncus effusus]|nr:hypothetical protein LUZ60_005721 [Juncus effusus]
MALEAIAFPQNLFSYTSHGYESYDQTSIYDLDSIVGENNIWDPFYSLDTNNEGFDTNSPSPPMVVKRVEPTTAEMATLSRRKRRRTKIVKNKEEIESQRMTHIAVERNRRKQMNEYLAVLRSLMPSSYAQRGDQASIVGGAINYVKELEQLLQSLEVRKTVTCQQSDTSHETTSPFAPFLTFPQYSSTTSCSNSNNNNSSSNCSSPNNSSSANIVESQPILADVEVTMVESHANLKVVARRKPRQLVKLVTGLQEMRLSPLHLNMTTVDSMIMYSFSLKVEDESKLTSVDEIATAVHQMLGRIHDESNF